MNIEEQAKLELESEKMREAVDRLKEVLTKPKNLVYCKNCRFCIRNTKEWLRCRNTPKITTTFFEPIESYNYCDDKNKDNQCKDYSPTLLTRIRRVLCLM